jgi:hypothetical protein
VPDHNEIVPDVDPEDVPGFTMPTKASELRDMSDEQLFRLVRRVGVENRWPISAKVEFEATGRLISALKDFKRTSAITAWVLIFLTVVLVGLTVAVVWLTYRLN